MLFTAVFFYSGFRAGTDTIFCNKKKRWLIIFKLNSYGCVYLFIREEKKFNLIRIRKENGQKEKDKSIEY